MKISKLRKEKKYKMCSWKRKGTPGSLIELNPVFNEIKKIKEKPVAKWNKGLDDLRERCQPAKRASSL